MSRLLRQSSPVDAPHHPDRYAPGELGAVGEILRPYGFDFVLDPMAGVGNIYRLTEYETLGVEIESRYATQHWKNVTGDATYLPDFLHPVPAIVTAPTLGNYTPYKRHLEELEERNTARFTFPSDRYERLHRDIWRAAAEILEPGGVLILVCRDFFRDGKLIRPRFWHEEVIDGFGVDIIDRRIVRRITPGKFSTRQMVCGSVLSVFRKPPRRSSSGVCSVCSECLT